jgi:hypothetical protein
MEMTLDELKELLEDTLASDYRITTDKRGQVIIYTGLAEDGDGELVGLDEIEEVDFDMDDESDIDLDELDEDEDEE